MIENAADRKDSSRSKTRMVPYAQAQNDGKSRVGLTMAGFFNGRAILGPFRVLIYIGRVPSGPRLQWSGPFDSSSGPFGSSIRLVGSYTPCGLYKETTMGAGWGRYLIQQVGDGSNIVVQTLLQTGYLPEQPQTSYDPKCGHCHMHTHTQND